MACGYCGTASSETDSSLPSYFDYWGNKKKATYGIGDNCPLATAYSNTHCADSDMYNSYYSGNEGWAAVNSLYPTYYGKYGTCIFNSVVAKGYSMNGRNNCLKVTCSSDKNTATVYFHRNEGSEDKIDCGRDDKGKTKYLSSSSQTGSIECPDVEKVCNKYNQDTF